MYITVDELTARATAKQVDIVHVHRLKKEEFIQLAQNFIELKTGRIFE